MNLNMALAVHPERGDVTVVGTDATNEVRFEPNVNGRFLRVLMASVDPRRPRPPASMDLNPHLDYATRHACPRAMRDAVPRRPARHRLERGRHARLRDRAWAPTTWWCIDAAGRAPGSTPTIAVGEGPTGLVLDEARAAASTCSTSSTPALSMVSTAAREHEVGAGALLRSHRPPAITHGPQAPV